MPDGRPGGEAGRVLRLILLRSESETDSRGRAFEVLRTRASQADRNRHVGERRPHAVILVEPEHQWIERSSVPERAPVEKDRRIAPAGETVVEPHAGREQDALEVGPRSGSKLLPERTAPCCSSRTILAPSKSLEEVSI
jgi:hypothetical protein